MTNTTQINNEALALGTSRRRSPWWRGFLLIPITLGFAALAWSPAVWADCREGCDTNLGTTFLGDNALANNTDFGNTAVGAFSLYFCVLGAHNTAVGDGAMLGSANSSPTGQNNTATGSSALFSYTTASNNTATGFQALFYDTTGSSNTATGYDALYFNTTGSFNTATGRGALYKNTASNNTATGYQALNKNTSGPGNTANGYQALLSNTTGGSNTATGYQSLYHSTGTANTANGQAVLHNNTTGSGNTALGSAALYENNTGSNNIAIGGSAGFFLTTGSNNIDIGNVGVGGESTTVRMGTVGTHSNTYIAGINGVTVAGGIGVIVDSSGHLGTMTSSARYKENIQPMDKASEAILSLQPVTFHYRKELDPKGIPQFGLVAEQVEKVDPDLVARDEQGKPYSVRYEAVNGMLLNEFLKAHRKLEEEDQKIAAQVIKAHEQEAAIAREEAANIAQQKQIQALTALVKNQAAQIQKVSDKLEPRRPTPCVATSN